jgi:hypothetical protein
MNENDETEAIYPRIAVENGDVFRGQYIYARNAVIYWAHKAAQQ